MTNFALHGQEYCSSYPCWQVCFLIHRSLCCFHSYYDYILSPSFIQAPPVIDPSEPLSVTKLKTGAQVTVYLWLGLADDYVKQSFGDVATFAEIVRELVE